MHEDLAEHARQAEEGSMLCATLFHFGGSRSEAFGILDLSGRIRRLAGPFSGGGANLAGRPWASLWEDGIGHQAALAAVFGGGRRELTRQTSSVDALHRVWDVSLSPMRGEEGRISGAIVTCRAVPEVGGGDASPSVAEARYNALVRSFGGIVWRSKPGGETVDVVRRDGMGQSLPLDDVKALCGSIVHPDDQDRFLVHWTACLQSHGFEPTEVRVRQSDGDYRWMIARVAPCVDSRGAVREWVGTLVDVHAHKQAQDDFADRDEQLRLAVSCTGLGIWSNELSTGRRIWSDVLRGIAGVPLDAAITRSLFEGLVHPDDLARVHGEIDGLRFDPQRDFKIEYRIRRYDTGEERHLLAWGRLVSGLQTGPTRFVGAVQDVTETVRMRLALEQSERRLQEALRAGGIVAWERDCVTGFVTRSNNAQEILGVGSEHVSAFLERVHAEDLPPLRAALDENCNPERRFCFRYRHPDGRQMWIESRGMDIGRDSTAAREVGINRDVTASKLVEERLDWAANHDALTGLRNRHSLQPRVEQAIGAALANGGSGAMLLLDLDDFKDVNDTLGHDAGDGLLRELASRLTSLVGEGCEVARLGGDEFVILFADAALKTDLDATLGRLQGALAAPVIERGHHLKIRTSGGVARFPEHGRSFSELLKAADLALYAAKGAGRNRIETFTPEMRQEVERRGLRHRELATAIDADRIIPFYQPKVDLSSGRVIGFEALARWRHPAEGLLSPAAFATAFDCPELGPRLSKRIRRQVMHDMRTWASGGTRPITVAINLSPVDFRNASLADEILDELDGFGISPSAFEVEITESVLLDGQSEHVLETLSHLHERGVKIALDDFGTGYASLTHLKRFPVDLIKIDRSFVSQLPSGLDDAAIVELVIGMAKTLRLQVVAEGVETRDQEAWLAIRGCDIGQGYRYAKPMDACRVPHHLRAADARAYDNRAVSRAG